MKRAGGMLSPGPVVSRRLAGPGNTVPAPSGQIGSPATGVKPSPWMKAVIASTAASISA
ncbi:MAG: hypothetical protein JWP20_2816 [Roseomonas sp.]|nr:hypothetical protein [Roseomonas sp.]